MEWLLALFARVALLVIWFTTPLAWYLLLARRLLQLGQPVLPETAQASAELEATRSGDNGWLKGRSR
jgi:hypothetical protein